MRISFPLLSQQPVSRWIFFPPTKQACIFLGSDTQLRASTGTAPRGSSGSTWPPEASTPPCIFAAVCLQKTVRWMMCPEKDLRFPLNSAWQILSQQDTKAHGSSSGNRLCSVGSATPAELTWLQRGERSGAIRPVVPSSEPRRSAQLHGRSPCVLLQPASIREEETSSLSYHISFFLMRRVTAGRAIHAPRPLIY